MKEYDYIVVGSGFFGSVVAERLKKRNKSVLVLERRNHIGGNCYTYEFGTTNITIHQYGTHIFHTSNQLVWNYVNTFSEFVPYHHTVLTKHKNKIYALPINLSTINTFFNSNFSPEEARKFLESKRERIDNPRNFEEKALALIGSELYQAFIKGYTMKQWGCKPTELPVDILARLPVRFSYYDSYYDDIYQALPKEGYTVVFERMLRNIPLELNVDFFDNRDYWMTKCKKVVYTGPLDRFFEYRYGRLGWRSVYFQIDEISTPDYQGTSVMNYADIDVPYTRIHEPKHLHLRKTQSPHSTVIMREYSDSSVSEPYYPINSEMDRKLLIEYKLLAKKHPKIIFGGRLAEYKYYDMHHVIEAALNCATQME